MLDKNFKNWANKQKFFKRLALYTKSEFNGIQYIFYYNRRQTAAKLTYTSIAVLQTDNCHVGQYCD